MQDTFACEHIRTKGTLVCDQENTQGTLGPEHGSTQGTLAAEHGSTQSTLASKHVRHGVLCDKFVPNQMHISFKSFVPDLAFIVSIKSNHHLVYNSVMPFESVPVNVSFAPIHVRVNVVKSVSCNVLASSLAKPMFIHLDSVRSLNVCNAVKSVISTHDIRRVIHDAISNHRQAFYPKTNILPSSKTKSFPSC